MTAEDRSAAAPAARAAPTTRGAFVLLALFLAYAAWIASAREVDFDFWYHMAEGKRIVETHRLAFHDTFSHTAAGQPYPPAEWLFQVMIYGFHAALGEAGIVLYKTLFVTAWGVVLVAAARRRGARLETAVAVAALALLAALNRFMARPEWVTFLGLALVAAHVYDEEEGRAGPRRRALLIAAILVWANAHPGVFFGVGMLWVWAMASAIASVRAAARGEIRPAHRAPALLALASTAAAFATPAGVGTLTFFLHHADVFRRLRVEEFQPLPFVPELGFIWLYIGLAGILFLLRRRDQTPFQRFAIPIFFLFAVRNARLVPLFIGVTAPLVPLWLERAVPALVARHALAGGLALAALASCAAYRVVETPRWGPIALSVDEQQVPRRAADFLDANGVRDPLYNFQGYGSYLLWRGFRVSTDARLPLYAEIIPQFQQRPFETINRFGLNVAVVPSPESPNAAFDPIATGLLKRRNVWAPVHRDDVAMVFLRRGAGHDGVIAERELGVP